MKVLSFSQGVDGAPNEIHIVPMGDYPQRGFCIRREDCEDIIRNFKAFGIKLVIDYEHQSLNTVDNGQPAPAAGWIGSLELREKGIYATQVEWTEDAKALIQSKKYGYVSPVLIFNDRDPHTDNWIGCSLHSVALTNTPYFRSDLEPLINARYANNKPVETGNKKEIDMTLEEQIAQMKAEIAALTSKNAEMEGTIAARDASLAQIETQKLVDDAIAAKKILPAQRETALFMANQGKEVFEKFVAATAAVNITETQNIPETADSSPADPKKEYDELLRNPAKAEKMKQESPQAFNALRDKALYGGIDTFKMHGFEPENPYHLRTNYDTAANAAYAAGQWQQIEEYKLYFPYLRYVTMRDEKVRDEHWPLDGLIYPVDDPFWDSYTPPNGWNCRCSVEQLMETELPKDYQPLEPQTPVRVDPMFKNNPGKSKKLSNLDLNAPITNWVEAGLLSLTDCPQHTAKELNLDNLTHEQIITLYSEFLGNRILLEVNHTPIFLDSTKALKLKGKSLSDLKGRMKYLPELEGVLTQPLEKWHNPNNKRCYYIKRFKENLIIMAEITESNTLEYFNILPAKDAYANKLRSGVLMYIYK